MKKYKGILITLDQAYDIWQKYFKKLDAVGLEPMSFGGFIDIISCNYSVY
jgi:hypothetical protein